jgi:hypothetical protein
MVFILFVALALTSEVMYRRMVAAEQKTAAAEQEVKKLRDVAGYLKIEDKNLFYAIALDTYYPLTWRWRVYLPPGHKYSWNMFLGLVPRDDPPKDGNITSTDGAPRAVGEEFIVNLSIRKDPNNKWLLSFSYRSAEGSGTGGLTAPIPDDVMQTLDKIPTEVECIGKGKAISLKLDKAVTLLKRRIGEKKPDGSWEWSTNPTPGIMLWLGTKP